MIDSFLKKVAVCPACLAKINLDIQKNRNTVKYYECLKCSRVYLVDKCGLIDFSVLDKIISLPEPYFGLWALAQNASLKEYKELSPASVSLKDREVVQAFKHFINLNKNSQILDVGSGTDYLPGYIDEKHIENYTALDPLPAYKNVDFRKVMAWGELMPFAESTFDCVILATSLDHILCLKSFMKELNRILKPGGSVYIWGCWYFEQSVFKNDSDAPLFSRGDTNENQNDIGIEQNLKYRQQIEKTIGNETLLKDRYSQFMSDEFHFRHIPLNFFKIVPQQYGFTNESMYIWDVNRNNYIMGFIKIRKSGSQNFLEEPPYYYREILKIREELSKNQINSQQILTNGIERITSQIDELRLSRQFANIIKKIF